MSKGKDSFGLLMRQYFYFKDNAPVKHREIIYDCQYHSINREFVKFGWSCYDDNSSNPHSDCVTIQFFKIFLEKFPTLGLKLGLNREKTPIICVFFLFPPL